MLKSIDAVNYPDWLKCDKNSFKFDIKNILQDSLYYPCSDFDGDPIKYLSGNVYSFIYVDHRRSEDELENELKHGFKGYHIIHKEDILKEQFTLDERILGHPDDIEDRRWEETRDSEYRRWRMSREGKYNHKEQFNLEGRILFVYPDENEYRRWEETRDSEDIHKKEFAKWIVFERDNEFDDSHGADRFSLLHICGDGIYTFQELYLQYEIAPYIIAVIQPGGGMGNWTNFLDETKIFYRTANYGYDTKYLPLYFITNRSRPSYSKYSTLVDVKDKLQDHHGKRDYDIYCGNLYFWMFDPIAKGKGINSLDIKKYNK